MGLLSLVPRPRPFEELSGGARDRVVLAAARDVRRAHADLLSLIDTVDTTGSFRDDGHRTVRAWVQAVLNCSTSEASRLVAQVRVLRDLPELADQHARGEIGAGQLTLVAAIRNNPRCRDRLAEFDTLLTDLARTLDYDNFHKACQRLIALCDPDGTHNDHQAAHQRRSCTTSIVGTSFHLDANGGTIDGAKIIEILDEFTQAEFEADWAALVEEHGPNPPAALLRRTHQQRRFDALRRICDLAAGAGEPAPERLPQVDFVIDWATFSDTFRRLVGLPVDEPEMLSLLTRRSETATGIPVDPVDIVFAAIHGRIRRIILDSAGTIIDAGRRQRLFTPRLAAIIRSINQRCTWPGCNRPAQQSHIDHANPWTGTNGQPGGHTSTHNANILCAHHNRYKNHGFRTWRDPQGHWHTIRPDGTEITPRPASTQPGHGNPLNTN